MGPGPDDKYLEKTAHHLRRAAPPSVALPGVLKAASRFIPPLSLGLLTALIVGAMVFYGYASSTDDRLSVSQRNALRTGVDQFRISETGQVDQRTLQVLQEMSGVRRLRWEAEPDQNGREVQSIQDESGRILGWLTWEMDRPLTTMAKRFLPLWLVVAIGLLVLGLLSTWYSRQLTEELSQANERIRRLMREDLLTGLPEAGAILDILEETLARREPGEFVFLFYLDLAGFREIADTFARPWSNDLVRAAADRLRELDWPNATLGRLGRHRFILILRAREREAGMLMAHDILRQVAKPMIVHGQLVLMRGNIGLAYAPRDGLTSDELFRHSTLAMRAAKRNGERGNVVAFEPAMETDLNERRFLEGELKRAIDEDALDLHYQPIVSADNAQVVGVEALLRWSHPTRGNIPPKVFVPVAEQTGMMGRLGEYVLYRAFNDAKRWPGLFISVNLSPIQVKDRALYDCVSHMLDETGIEPSRVILEITEGVLIDDPEETRKRLQEIRDLGVRIAIDDFGAGYSSLSYLQSFPFDKLKIDRGFVAPLGKSENSGFIIQAIVALGRALNLSVLVEGVETEEQRVLLRLAGCDEMQGYLFARPGPRQMIDSLLVDAKLEAARSATAAARVS
jgi:diguanylate cyclase (GGDEF)-like protein